MDNQRAYGTPPYTVAVLHGGPGAPGSAAAVARALADEWGVLEPLQTRDSVDGQIEELREVLASAAQLPVALVGHSWGAMLGVFFTARYPAMVRKLILAGSGVFTDEAASDIEPARQARMTPEQRAREAELAAALDDPAVTDKNAIMAQMGALSEAVDTYAPLDNSEHEAGALPVSYEIYTRVWSDAAARRARGELLDAARQIRCPVVAIHGDYDPHPAEGIRTPLAAILSDFRWYQLERCGHSPWRERFARDEFFRILREEMRT
jgi:pimeloyl-ACP methyl ester carboxylesterase